ncbi:MAG: hypothetical protein KN64_00290 [Sulfurovum sp. AS07-7]|nr:MAG: hypothetical protein KN64_04810 [Sulfurovum sp. AS07-7]KIM05988.1 MAG: hypothetical protein KN64_00290 [Sulfurovum sp. AS07-7]
MLSQRSLKNRFLFELAVAMTAMLVLVTVIFYSYLSTNLFESVQSSLEIKSQYIISKYQSQDEFEKDINPSVLNSMFDTTVQIIPTTKDKLPLDKNFQDYNSNEHYFLEYTKIYPNQDKYLKLRKDITEQKNILTRLYYVMITIIVLGLVFIIIYSSFLSTKLLQPLQKLSYKFAHMNESLLQHIDTSELPKEFIGLGGSINLLMTKIQTFINYRKELFVGMAHELKTPLAVMRLKTQITLMKYKPNDKIKETLENNIAYIDNLNNMIQHVLEYGRAEGAQFEQPQRIDLIRFLAQKAEEFELLAQAKDKKFIYHFDIEHFTINIQPLLFTQIFQNFVQNALRFTPEGGLVSIDAHMDGEYFIVEIIDEGEGIDESKDLFAPFIRSQSSSGAGLGLFLAKNAAQSMGVEISLKNRKDKKGAIATILFTMSRFLLR